MNAASEKSPLTRLEKLVDSEKYREALQDIGKFRKMKLSTGDRLRVGVLESRCLMGLGEFSKAFKAADSVVEEGSKLQEHKTHVIEGLVQMACASWGLGNPDMILKLCEQAEQLRQELPKDDVEMLEFLRADILYHQAPGFYYKDDVHKGIEYAKESVSINERLGHLAGVVAGLMRVGYLHLEIAPDLTFEYQERGL
jgi:hypothetical protein